MCKTLLLLSLIMIGTSCKTTPSAVVDENQSAIYPDEQPIQIFFKTSLLEEVWKTTEVNGETANELIYSKVIGSPAIVALNKEYADINCCSESEVDGRTIKDQIVNFKAKPTVLENGEIEIEGSFSFGKELCNESKGNSSFTIESLNTCHFTSKVSNTTIEFEIGDKTYLLTISAEVVKK